MKKRITKRQMIKAVMTEPLVSGSWIAPKATVGDGCAWFDKNEHRKAADVSCNVCAVGAVLRAGVGTAATVDDIEAFGASLAASYYHVGGIAEDDKGWAQPEEEKKEVLTFEQVEAYYSQRLGRSHREHLAALSGLFETLWDRYELYSCNSSARGSKVRALRIRLANWIRNNMPSNITVNI